MSSLEQPIILIGGGMTSLLAALALSKAKKRIIVLERGRAFGGLYQSHEPQAGKIFDIGMHVLYETCVKRIDALIAEPLPDSEWNVFGGNEKDIAGLFYRGRLQTHSPYMDLRSFSPMEREVFWKDMIKLRTQSVVEDWSNVKTYGATHFGTSIAESVLEPAVEKLFGVPGDSLDCFALKISGMERVLLFDAEEMTNQLEFDWVRARVGYPDQLALPLKYKSSQRALYPKRFGMAGYVGELTRMLERNGVELIAEAEVCALEIRDRRVEKVGYVKNGRLIALQDPELVIWSVGVGALLKALVPNFSPTAGDSGLAPVYVSVELKSPPKMAPLYYFYCYDRGYRTFRVTHYNAYCPSLDEVGRNALAVEIWPHPGDEMASMFGLVARELTAFGIIADPSEISFFDARGGGVAIPLPTLRNCNRMEEARQIVETHRPRNLVSTGVMSEPGLFFLPDILRDAFQKIEPFGLKL